MNLDKKHISKSLYEVLIKELSQKKWEENDKFYSIRQISIKYSINPNTVLKVFQRLENEGYLYMVKGKGCFIKKGYNLSIGTMMIPILNTFRFGQNSDEVTINFANGASPKEFFPYKEYQEIITEILLDENQARALMGYQNIQGLKSLRETLETYLKKFAIYTSKDNILICSSTQATLELICSTLGSSPRKTFLFSEPTYQNAIQLVSNFCDIESIDLKADGWDMHELEKILETRKIHFIYIVTNFQNPTGITWSLEKKKKLLEFSKKYDFFIIEDDFLSDFYYENSPVRSLKSLDRNDRVFYIKTFSKIVMPGVALSLFIPPRKFINFFSLSKYFIDTTTSGIHQKFLEIFIKRGLLDEHLAELREIFKEKMNFMLDELSTLTHIKILHRPKGGFFIWIELASYIDEEKFYYKCHLHGLSLLPGFIFYPQRQKTSKIRISVINTSFDEIKKGVEIMRNILNNCEAVRLNPNITFI